MKIITFLLLLVASSPSWPADRVTTDINAINTTNDLGHKTLYFEELGGEKTINQVLLTKKKLWKESGDRQINLGYSDSAFWFQLAFINTSPLQNKRLLKIGYDVLDKIDIYTVRNNGDIEHSVLGDKLKFEQRFIQHRHFLVPITFNTNEIVDLYLRVKTTSSIQLPLSLWEVNKFYQEDQLRLIFHGVYFGIVLVMVIYNLFVYFAVSEKTYLYYVACISFMAMFIATLNGLAFQFLWPNSTWWNDQSIIFFLNGMIVFSIIFSIDFLSIHYLSQKRSYFFLTLLALVSAVLMALCFVIPYEWVIKPTLVTAMTTCIALLCLGLFRWYKGATSARYFTIAWISLLLGGIVLALNEVRPVKALNLATSPITY